MQNFHSIYYNDSPEEAVKKAIFYIRRNLILSYVICMVLLIGIFYFYSKMDNFLNGVEGVWYGLGHILFSLLYVAMLLIFLILGLKILLPFSQRPNVQLLLILMGDCDPVKMYEVYSVWEQYDKKGKGKNMFMLQKAQCCRYIPERREEGRTYLEQLDFKKKQLDVEATRLYNIAVYAKYGNDRVGFEKAKAELEQLSNQYPGNKIQKKEYERTLQIVTLQELLWDEKDAEARALLNTFLETEKTPLNKVMLHMHFARLDMKVKDYENAKKHLDYVITYGNKLPVVPEAKELLDTCNM